MGGGAGYWVPGTGVRVVVGTGYRGTGTGPSLGAVLVLAWVQYWP